MGGERENRTRTPNPFAVKRINLVVLHFSLVSQLTAAARKSSAGEVGGGTTEGTARQERKVVQGFSSLTNRENNKWIGFLD